MYRAQTRSPDISFMSVSIEEPLNIWIISIADYDNVSMAYCYRNSTWDDGSLSSIFLENGQLWFQHRNCAPQGWGDDDAPYIRTAVRNYIDVQIEQALLLETADVLC